MKSILARSLFAALAVVVTLGFHVVSGFAQCSTCPTGAVATTVFQPVAVAPVRTGWYPSKLFDQMRLSRWGFGGAAAPTYTAAYAPTYYNPANTTNFAPYTAAYAPASTVAYRPYVTAYAPLARTTAFMPVVQTAYSPIVATGCNTCAVPTTVQRQVTLRPVTSPCCTTCNFSPCCCSSGVSQASHTSPLACPSCAPASSEPVYSGTPSAGPQTPQPQLAPDYAAPPENSFKANKPESPAEGSELEPQALPEENPSTSFEAPRLFLPNDRTARRSGNNSPSVDVWQAVYHKPVTARPISHPTGRTRTQAEITADGWRAVSR